MQCTQLLTEFTPLQECVVVENQPAFGGHSCLLLVLPCMLLVPLFVSFYAPRCTVFRMPSGIVPSMNGTNAACPPQSFIGTNWKPVSKLFEATARSLHVHTCMHATWHKLKTQFISCTQPGINCVPGMPELPTTISSQIQALQPILYHQARRCIGTTSLLRCSSASTRCPDDQVRAYSALAS